MIGTYAEARFLDQPLSFELSFGLRNPFSGHTSVLFRL